MGRALWMGMVGAGPLLVLRTLWMGFCGDEIFMGPDGSVDVGGGGDVTWY